MSLSPYATTSRSPKPRGSLLPGIAAIAGAILITAGVAPVAPAASAATPSISVVDLSTNARVNPIGIPGADPTFGWVSESEMRGVTQSAYEIEVGSTVGANDIWDTGRVASDDQVEVVYGGPDLTAGSKYYWRVKVWDGDGGESAWSEPATFETALLSASDWGAAKWISRGAPTYSQWDDYTLTTDFKINNLAFGVMIRSDSTFANGYLWQIARSTANPDYAVLKPHTKVNGRYTASTVELRPFGITWAQLTGGYSKLSIVAAGNQIVTSINGVQVDSRTYSNFSVGQAGLRSGYSGSVNESASLTSFKVVRANGDVLANADLNNNASNPFTLGSVADGVYTLVGRNPENTSGYRDAAGPGGANKPLLRKGFETLAGKTVSSARVYASAQGVYELSLNGKKVGDQHLAPGYTNYNQRLQSQTYDVTDLLETGTNVVGGMLGDGWFAGKIGGSQPGQAFGSAIGLLARLKVVYTDGTVQWIDSDASWKWAPGPIVEADLQDGERYNAAYERAGWNTASYSDAAWAPAGLVTTTATARLVPQPDEPVRTVDELAVKKMTEPIPGTRIYDLGQNMVGVTRVTLTGAAGDTVRLRHGEMLYTAFYPDREGQLYVDNLRGAKATDYYTFGPDCGQSCTITYSPTFTQHGFRYLEVSGVDDLPESAEVTGVVWGSDLERRGTLQTSNGMLNQLASNVYWGARGNFLSIPTDTPARDERAGWLGDISVFAPSANYLFDSRAFLSKFLTDMAGEQRTTSGINPAGSLPVIAPYPTSMGVTNSRAFGWEDAAVTIPYATWQATGSVEVLNRNWSMMERFTSYVLETMGDDNIDPDAGRCRGECYSDWLNLNDSTALSLLSTAHSAEVVRMMAEMAEATGNPNASVYSQRYQAIREAYTARFFAADGSVTVGNGSQTAYAMSLAADLISDPAIREAAGEKLIEKLAASDNHLTTGFLGLPWLLPALSSIGREDIAFEVLLQDDYPSWGYEIAMGATTVWERWNSLLPTGQFGDVSMNSFNHFAYGAVMDWMQSSIGGIQIDGPGYKSSVIDPRVGGGITSASNEIRTDYGTLSSEWEATEDAFTIDVVVPVNTTSTVRIPTPDGRVVTVDGTPVGEVDGVRSVKVDEESGVTSVELGSGTYAFEAAEVEDAALTASATTEVRCVATRAALAVTVANTNDVPVTFEIVADHGSKTFAGVAPGKSVFHTFTTRLRTVQAGSVQVTVKTEGDATLPAGRADATYPARTC